MPMSFAALGLSALEEDLYRALLEGGAAGSAPLARRMGLPVSRVRLALSHLEEKGLVSRAPGRTPAFAPARPDLALESLVLRRIDELEGVRREAGRLADRFPPPVKGERRSRFVQLVTGSDATLQWAMQVQRAATRTVRLIDVPPHVLPPTGPNPAEMELLAKGIEYRILYHETSFDVPGKLDAARACIAAGEEARVYGGPLIKLIIADERLAFSYDTRIEPIQDSLIVHPSFLLEQLVTLFDVLWSHAVSLSPGDAVVTVAGHDLDSLDRQIVALLAVGSKDDRIARQLGVGVRTVRRRAGLLMTMLGASTRFQAGVEAAKRGLI